ncbi:Bacterial regulatory protein, MarR [metagenome]|uniref:Bacterial regulatory protein, MarR n=1 Tax=metagenome TaxID=256318 RepID=A0A2P2BWI9_9ZZZZ
MSENTGDLLMSTARALRRQDLAALAEWDITPSQSRALRIVCELESARISVLADRLHIAPRSATEVVDALESRGLVTRTEDPADRRAICVLPTQQGASLRRVMDQTRRAATEEFLAVLSEADRRDLARILATLVSE